MAGDPEFYRAQANVVYERAGGQLRELLKSVARDLDPFPPFPGSLFTLGIEVDGPVPGDEHGCVILGEDGELYELQLGVDVNALAAGAHEPALAREETRVVLEGLSPGQYLGYAQRALEEALAELERRG
ncbi:MAG: hypothetical protein EXR66_00120 [Dehalococcoidia bacterium]|nr:hypothetical protein [Dehalococcoidia bacterium]